MFSVKKNFIKEQDILIKMLNERIRIYSEKINLLNEEQKKLQEEMIVHQSNDEKHASQLMEWEQERNELEQKINLLNEEQKKLQEEILNSDDKKYANYVKKWIPQDILYRLETMDSLDKAKGTLLPLTLLGGRIEFRSHISDKNLSDAGRIRLFAKIFEFFAEAIYSNGGMIYRFDGDFFVAVFGMSNVVTKAIIENSLNVLFKRIHQLNGYLKEKQISPFTCYTGLYSSEMLVGCVGDTKQNHMIIFGDAISILQRMIHQAKEHSEFVVACKETELIFGGPIEPSFVLANGEELIN